MRVLQRHAFAILIVGVVAMVAAYFASFLVSPTYSSTARVLMRARDVRYLNANGQDMSNSPGVIDSVLAKALTETSSGLIGSQAVAEQIVNDLQLDQPRPVDSSLFGQIRHAFKQVYTQVYAYVRYGFYAEPPAREGAVAAVQGSLSVLPVKESYLIDIQAKADDPELAAGIANAATRAFVDASRKRVQEEAGRYRGFLNSEVDAARQRVDTAQAAVRTYKESHGITSIDDQLKLTASGLDEGHKALDGADAQLRDAQARLDSIQTAIADVSATDVSTTSVETHNSSSSPQTVTSETTAASPGNTSTVETGRSVTTTQVDPINSTQNSRSTTSATTEQNTSETHTSTSPNKVYQDLKTQQLSVQAEVAGLQARRDALASALADRVQAGQGLPGMDEQLAALQLQVNAATNAYSAIRSSYESAAVNAAQQANEISPVDQARPPLYPEKPWRWLFGVVGLLLGIFGGAGLALFVGLRSGTYRPGAARGRFVPRPAVPALATSIIAPASTKAEAEGLTGPSPA